MLELTLKMIFKINNNLKVSMKLNLTNKMNMLLIIIIKIKKKKNQIMMMKNNDEIYKKFLLNR